MARVVGQELGHPAVPSALADLLEDHFKIAFLGAVSEKENLSFIGVNHGVVTISIMVAIFGHYENLLAIYLVEI